MYVSDQPTPTATSGIKIAAGGYLEMNLSLGWDTQKTWYIIASGATTTGILITGYGKQTFISSTKEIAPSSPRQEPLVRDP